MHTHTHKIIPYSLQSILSFSIWNTSKKPRAYIYCNSRSASLQLQFSSVQSLRHVQLFATHGLQHARLPCPSPSPKSCSNSCPPSQWCHPTISSSVISFASHLQSFPASGSFLMSQFFVAGGQILELQLQHQSSQWMRVCVCVCVLVTQSCLTNYDPRTTVACQAPLSMGFSMQEYWSRLPLSSPGPHNEYSGLISFRSDWFDLLAVQETLKNLL